MARTETLDLLDSSNWDALSEDCGHVVVFGLVVETPCGSALCQNCAAAHSCPACDWPTRARRLP